MIALKRTLLTAMLVCGAGGPIRQWHKRSLHPPHPRRPQRLRRPKT